MPLILDNYTAGDDDPHTAKCDCGVWYRPEADGVAWEFCSTPCLLTYGRYLGERRAA